MKAANNSTFPLHLCSIFFTVFKIVFIRGNKKHRIKSAFQLQHHSHRFSTHNVSGQRKQFQSRCWFNNRFWRLGTLWSTIIGGINLIFILTDEIQPGRGFLHQLLIFALRGYEFMAKNTKSLKVLLLLKFYSRCRMLYKNCYE